MHILAASTCSVFAGFFDRIQITFEGNFRICKCLGQRKSILAVVSYLGKKTNPLDNGCNVLGNVVSWKLFPRSNIKLSRCSFFPNASRNPKRLVSK